MGRRKKVTFVAQKTYTKPEKVKFKTADGIVTFTAKKKTTKPVKVTFYVKTKKRGR
jgi:diaminopimelate epimerase